MKCPPACLFLLCFATALSASESSKGIWPASEVPDSSDSTSLRILNLHLKARGGPEKIRLVSTLILRGRLQEGRESFDLTRYHARPASLRSERRRDHLGWQYHTVTVVTPESGWSQAVLPETDRPGTLSDDDHRRWLLEARLPFLLLHPDQQGHRFVYKGKVRFAGKEAYLLHGFLASGTQLDVHIDAETFHVLNYRHPFRIAGKKVLVDRMPLGLRRIDGVWFESGYDFRVKGESLRRIEFTEIIPNHALPAKAFQRPRSSSITLTPEGPSRAANP